MALIRGVFLCLLADCKSSRSGKNCDLFFGGVFGTSRGFLSILPLPMVSLASDNAVESLLNLSSLTARDASRFTPLKKCQRTTYQMPDLVIKNSINMESSDIFCGFFRCQKYYLKIFCRMLTLRVNLLSNMENR